MQKRRTEKLLLIVAISKGHADSVKLFKKEVIKIVVDTKLYL